MKTERRSSGNAALDRLLGGGLEVRTITQFYGEPASGKSTVMHDCSGYLPSGRTHCCVHRF